jgi:cellobiose phosphorylase
MLGNNNEAYKIFRDLIPDNVVNKFGVDLYTSEPYIFSSNIRGPKALNGGQAGVSWLSGTASWMMIAVEQYIMGLKPRYDGLEVSPCIPDAWEKATAQRIFRGTTYHIEIDNSAHKGNSIKETYVNGELFNGKVIPANGKDITVKIVMG